MILSNDILCTHIYNHLYTIYKHQYNDPVLQEGQSYRRSMRCFKEIVKETKHLPFNTVESHIQN